MTDGLDKIRAIDREKLSGEFYFQSLLEQAHNKGLLSDGDIERLQYECLDLLIRKTERYNTGDSSSIRVEKAQSIMASNLFTIGLWLKTYANPDDAVSALRNEPIDDVYRNGRNRIDTMTAAAKDIHKALLAKLVDTKNVFYRSTIEGGIGGFFKLYYPDFAAQEIHITADYPTYNPIPKSAGIEFISAYLNALYYENLFCHSFYSDDIHHLLCGYDEDYQELLMNIYEPVLLAAIGCTIAGTDAGRLDISESEAAYLQRLFCNMSKAEIRKTIQNAAASLNGRFRFRDGLTRYIQSSLPLIADRIEAAARANTLDRIFFVPAFPENKPKIVFSFGDKMEDEAYRRVIEEIGQCRFSQDKAAIIKTHIRSLADLEDVLLDADLTPAEIQAVLQELSLPEIAALSKKYRLTSDRDTDDLREREQVLQSCLQGVVAGLSAAQKKWLAETGAAIEPE